MPDYYVDADGHFLGIFADGAVPPQGAIDVATLPPSGDHVWDGAEWIAPVLPLVTRLSNIFDEALTGAAVPVEIRGPVWILQAAVYNALTAKVPDPDGAKWLIQNPAAVGVSLPEGLTEWRDRLLAEFDV